MVSRKCSTKQSASSYFTVGAGSVEDDSGHSRPRERGYKGRATKHQQPEISSPKTSEQRRYSSLSVAAGNSTVDVKSPESKTVSSKQPAISDSKVRAESKQHDGGVIKSRVFYNKSQYKSTKAKWGDVRSCARDPNPSSLKVTGSSKKDFNYSRGRSKQPDDSCRKVKSAIAQPKGNSRSIKQPKNSHSKVSYTEPPFSKQPTSLSSANLKSKNSSTPEATSCKHDPACGVVQEDCI